MWYILQHALKPTQETHRGFEQKYTHKQDHLYWLQVLLYTLSFITNILSKTVNK